MQPDKSDITIGQLDTGVYCRHPASDHSEATPRSGHELPCPRGTCPVIAAGLRVSACCCHPVAKGKGGGDEAGRLTHGSRGQLPCQLSAVGFEPTRSCLQWILSPPP